MNFRYLLLALILIIQGFMVVGSIQLTQPLEEVYNIGDRISLKVEISTEEGFEGLFRVTLKCENRQLPYYITPIRIFAWQRMEEKVPDLTLSRHITGKCKIISDMASSDGTIKEEDVIGNILITDKLNLSLDKFPEYLPGQEIIFSGALKDMNGNTVKNASLILNFNDRDFDVQIKNGVFRYVLKTSDNIRSGVHYVTAIAEDQYGNKADTLSKLVITPKPSSIEPLVNKYSFHPGESIEIITRLVDQNKEFINDTIKISIKNPRGSVIFSQDALSNTKMSHNFDQFALPGIYIIRAEKDEIFEEKLVNVSKVERLEVTLEGNQLLVKNIGNVRYEDRANLVVEANGKKYIISKNLKLIPGEIIEIDISKEVPEGNYNIGLEPANPKFAVNYAGLTDTGIKQISDVPIEDKRPLYKRVLQGLTGITGAVIGAKEGITAPFYLLLLLIFILLVILYLHKRYFKSYSHLEEPLHKKSEVSRMLDKSLENKK